ncbi:MAG: hypothetical protein ABIP39_15265 [Polyangiaceae bacterium]
MIGKTLLLALSCLAVGCGGSVYEITSDEAADSGSSDGGKNGSDAAHGDSGGRDGGGHTDASGPFACGKTICGADEYCVHPCCGGIRPLCTPLLDDGGCAPGETYDNFCPSNGGSSGPGCDPGACTPAEPYCTGTTGGGASCGPPQSGSRDIECICG